ncbi:hypothetical protein V8E53_003776 [Lactarius tabidus]
MSTGNPPEFAFPDLLGPILSYISSCLPPPVYNALLALVVNGLAFISALLRFGTALISSRPSDWDVQKIVPPLFTLLVAYLALSSAVRTATWFVRTTTWMIKWGIITAVASVAAGWIYGGVVPSLAGMALDMLNGYGQDAASGPRGATRRARPQAWESFDQHLEWQFDEQQWNAADATTPAQHVQQFVADAVQRAKDGGWWSVARGALQSFSDPKPSERNGGATNDDDSADLDGERRSEPRVRTESI